MRRLLVDGGWFIFSVEHPIFTATGTQDWCYDTDNHRRHWPVDRYLQEGIRNTNWMADNVVKYHRTIETYVNNLIDAKIGVRRLCKPKPAAQMVEKHPDWKDESRRPMFLLISAVSG